ncbi:hypothetical protein [Planomonospora sp. ID82291]|uniref:hypothetical protein n=1 Tax=Planomonospora sp. ID82291 TaxID=2738136 RepID=UPI0018C416D5|nr:hypothetical protein [Planomonospora sp. ID82291]MBG0818984.1 hypothetical protein [Planomonospora sp. ID82291]
MTATRKTRSTSGEQAAPAETTPATGEQPEPTEQAPAPVTPAAQPTQAAPLTPPAAPARPAPDPGPAPQIRMLATPGSEFVDLLWGDNPPGQAPEQARPEELFIDPGAQFSYVTVARPLVKLFYLPGTTAPSEQLFRAAGSTLARDHAAKVRADLEAIRAAQDAQDAQDA